MQPKRIFDESSTYRRTRTTLQSIKSRLVLPTVVYIFVSEDPHPHKTQIAVIYCYKLQKSNKAEKEIHLTSKKKDQIRKKINTDVQTGHIHYTLPVGSVFLVCRTSPNNLPLPFSLCMLRTRVTFYSPAARKRTED